MPDPITPDRIAQAVAERRGALTDFLRTLVDMDSPTEDRDLTNRVGDVLAAKAASLGMKVEIDPQPTFADNRIARYTCGRPNAPKVLLIGHFDTVYAANTTVERPFAIHGDRITGPGSLDMKGGLAIGLFALEAIAASGGIMFDVTFIFNSDEEIGSPASRAVILQEARKHDVALVLEPGRPGPALTIERKGVGIFHVDIEGREAHAGADPENGRNAIVEAAHKILAIDTLNDPATGTSVTCGVVAGGTKPYVVPGHVRLSIDCRVPTEAERVRVEAGLAKAAANSIVPDTRSRLSGSFHRPPMEMLERTHAYLARYQAIAASFGTPIGASKTGGASDGNLTAAAGTPTLDGLGPHGGRAHSPEEWVELQSLETKCRSFAAFLASLAEDPL